MMQESINQLAEDFTKKFLKTLLDKCLPDYEQIREDAHSDIENLPFFACKSPEAIETSLDTLIFSQYSLPYSTTLQRLYVSGKREFVPLMQGGSLEITTNTMKFSSVSCNPNIQPSPTS